MEQIKGPRVHHTCAITAPERVKLSSPSMVAYSFGTAMFQGKHIDHYPRVPASLNRKHTICQGPLVIICICCFFCPSKQVARNLQRYGIVIVNIQNKSQHKDGCMFYFRKSPSTCYRLCRILRSQLSESSLNALDLPCTNIDKKI